MAVFQSPAGLYEIVPTPGGANDLRYGSEVSRPMGAFPSLYGLHDGAFAPVRLGDRVQLTPVSYARLFATQPWVRAVIMRLLSSAVAVPLKVYRRNDDGSKVRLMPGDHRLADAIYRPWERAGQFELTAALLGSLLVHGNGTVRVLSGANDSISFESRDWRYLTPLQVLPSKISGWETDEDGVDETIPLAEMLHAAWWSPLGPAGVSPLAALGTTIEIDNAAARYQRAALRNMAAPPSAITVSQDLLDLEPEKRQAALDTMRQQIAERHTGDNAGLPAILPAGLDWKAVGHTAVEAELIDQRRVAREEVCGVYQMPPPMVGILDRATFSNIETQREMLYADALGPPLALVESVLNAQLVHGLLAEPDLFVEYDFAGVLRGNRLAEMQALTAAIGSALMTPNEGRATLNYAANPSPAADELYLPTNNLAPIGTQAAQPPQPPNPAQPAPAQAAE